MPVSKEIQAWAQEVYSETHLFITNSLHHSPSKVTFPKHPLATNV